jgi:hypothetical protein
MLRITIEVLPSDGSPPKVVAKGRIENIGDGALPDMGEYLFTGEALTRRGDTRRYRSTVYRWPRTKRDAMELLAECLRSAAGLRGRL